MPRKKKEKDRKEYTIPNESTYNEVREGMLERQ
jgi:hypothetical protein